ncbi:DMT family transporter [Salipaludibacillus aurantiacus]|uniref:Threonine/homoserine efflux transporter RhtA n=1 Tax=Salipaludibacillus aurantiacus TaxID=1601833 RepID=A0A1H9WDM4_9BACI|nr:DMT family transporter [Salipaludibacillus aurantiacus]SES31777.1 Threonine/homoserine efflux transporter RhtA [Salipaludibacillus aurantiacus]
MKTDLLERKPWIVYIMLAFATSSWGSAFIAGNFATQDLSPSAVAFFRFFFATLLLIPLMLWMDKGGRRPKGKEWFLVCLLGLTGIALYNIAFFIAARDAPIVKSSLFIASNPVLIAVLSGLFLKEKITGKNVIGLVLALSGAFIIITEGNVRQLAEAGLAPIDLILLLAVVCWALYSVLGKVALQKYSAITSTTYAVGAGTIMLFPFAFMDTAPAQLQNASLLTWGSILHMSIIVSVASFIMYYQGIKMIGAAKASIFINLMPLSAVILAMLLLGEPFLYVHMAGALLVLTGVTVGTRRNGQGKKRNSAKSETTDSVKVSAGR